MKVTESIKDRLAREAAEAEAELNGPKEGAVPPVEPIIPPTDPEPTPTPEPVVPPATDEHTAEYWQGRFNTVNGKYLAELPPLRDENTRLKARVTELEGALAESKTSAASTISAATLVNKSNAEILQIAYDDLGQEVVDPIVAAVKAAVMAEMKPYQEKLDAVESTSKKTAEQIHAESILKYEGRLDELVPKWDSFSGSPEFINWVDTTPIPGTTNVPWSVSLNAAHKNLDAVGTAAVFKAYLLAIGKITPPATPPPVVPAKAPLSALDAMIQPDSLPDGKTTPGPKIYTADEAAAVYEEVRQAKSAGTYYERKAILDDRLKAVQLAEEEGRVRG